MDLIEEIGVLFEQTHKITPLASRIVVMLILSPADGYTFEEIVEITNASKSSVSTQLNFLLQQNRIEYFTKSGERKRYFRASKGYLKLRLEELLENIQKEIELAERLTAFNRENNPEKYEMHKPLTSLFQDYLKAQEENLQTAITKMKKINKAEDRQ